MLRDILNRYAAAQLTRILPHTMHAATETKIHANYGAELSAIWTAVLVSFGVQWTKNHFSAKDSFVPKHA
jgi:hypothetical protein